MTLPLALAAAAMEPSRATLEEVLVTARKRPEPLLSVPVSVAVIDADFLELRSLNSLESLSALQPGLDISRNSAAGKVFLRGVGSQGNAGLDQSVSTYVDDVYHGRSRSTKAGLVDVDRIEVLRGPQSIYLGLNASAGAVAIHNRAAELNEQGGYLRARVGADSAAGATLAYNVPLGDRAAVRLVADYADLPDFWTMVAPDGQALVDSGGGEAQTYRVSGRWAPTQSLQVDLKLEHQDIVRDNPYAWQPGRCGNLYGLGLADQAQLDAFWAATGSAQASPLRVPLVCRDDFATGEFDGRSPASPFNRSDFLSQESRLALRYELGTVDLVATTGWFDHDFGFRGNDLTHGAPQHRIFWVADDSRQTSQELRLESAGDGRRQWVAGVYGHRGRADFESGDADGRNNPQFVHNLARQEETTVSAFAAYSRELSDRWTLGAGLRWIRTRKSFAGLDERATRGSVGGALRDQLAAQVLADVVANPAAYAVYPTQVRGQFDDQRRTFDEWLPSIDLQYQPRPGLMTYYSWTRGFKAGGFNFRLSGVDESTLSFASETVSAHELGVKGQFLAGRLDVAAALFVSDYRDLQQNSNRGDDGVISAAVIRNAARASSDGLELEARWRLNERWQLEGTMVWLDAQFDDYQGADCTRFQSVVSRTDVAAAFGAERNGNRCSQDLSGGRLTSAPELASRFGVAYEQPLRGSLSLRAQADWVYSDEFFTSPHADPLRRQPSFSKYNLSVSLLSTQWQLDLLATNLTNELTARQLGQDQDAAVSGLLDDPRQVFLQYRFNF
ncbi:MAG: TonB-dependent receptor [Pseudomonadota bacterium]